MQKFDGKMDGQADWQRAAEQLKDSDPQTSDALIKNFSLQMLEATDTESLLTLFEQNCLDNPLVLKE